MTMLKGSSWKYLYFDTNTLYFVPLGSRRWSRYGQIRILRLYQAPLQIQWIRIVQVGCIVREPGSGRPPFVKQQARLAGPTLSELASISGARRSAIQPSRARRRLADDTKGLPGLEGPPEANRLLAPGHSRALLLAEVS